MTNKGLSVALMALSIGCWLVLLLFDLPYFLLQREHVQAIFIIQVVSFLIIGSSAFFRARSHAKHARDDEERP